MTRQLQKEEPIFFILSRSWIPLSRPRTTASPSLLQLLFSSFTTSESEQRTAETSTFFPNFEQETSIRMMIFQLQHLGRFFQLSLSQDAKKKMLGIVKCYGTKNWAWEKKWKWKEKNWYKRIVTNRTTWNSNGCCNSWPRGSWVTESLLVRWSRIWILIGVNDRDMQKL